MLMAKPEHRRSAEEIMKMPYFNGMEVVETERLHMNKRMEVMPNDSFDVLGFAEMYNVDT